MKCAYRVSRGTDGGFVAAAESLDGEGRGVTVEEAVRELRRALRDRYARVEAVAPPPGPPPVEIELVRIDDGAAPEADRSGPGAP